MASADPEPAADVTQSADTDDGWHLSASLSKMTINSVPNMAATALTREGFVTGKASAKIDGNGKVAVNTGQLILGVQLGCQVDLSQGGNFSLSGTLGVGFNLGSGTGLGAFGPSPYADISPSISVNILPGNINTLGLGKIALKGRTGEITVHDAHVKVDGCGGPVVVRFFTYAEIATDNGQDSVNTYGDILNL
ncbi:MAG: MspA family porin [Mycobacteriaceae bacterium]|nr:MspA family porin [Mycobacteriaceae bacterium]